MVVAFAYDAFSSVLHTFIVFFPHECTQALDKSISSASNWKTMTDRDNHQGPESKGIVY